MLLDKSVADQIAEPPPGVIEFVKRLQALASDPDENQRLHIRYPVLTVVTLAPLDQYYRPAGPPFKAVTRDVSAVSISFLHTRAIVDPQLAVLLNVPGRGVETFIAKVLRCAPIGPLYDVACQFTNRVALPTS